MRSRLIAAALMAAVVSAKAGDPLAMPIGDEAGPPVGWVGFCLDYPHECNIPPTTPRDATFSPKAWEELVKINRLVNSTIKPMSDLEHYGVIEKWTYPDDGYGDCEDYVLLKRRMLIEAGWPREALLVTIVRESSGDGHAVLTVKTDRGEFVLDNQNDKIVPWSESGYRFVKRQSQSAPSLWVAVGDQRPARAIGAHNR